MKAFLLVMLSLLVTSSCSGQLPYTQKQVVAYARSIDVKTLDSSLPSQRLEDWLQSGPPHARIGYWIVANTCDLKPDSQSEDYPLCAKVSFTRNGKGGFFLVQVGTNRRGIIGRPQLYGDIEIVKLGKKEGWTLTGSAERLSDLPTLLD
jgi:hypothetical protein